MNFRLRHTNLDSASVRPWNVSDLNEIFSTNPQGLGQVKTKKMPTKLLPVWEKKNVKLVCCYKSERSASLRPWLPTDLNQIFFSSVKCQNRLKFNKFHRNFWLFHWNSAHHTLNLSIVARKQYNTSLIRAQYIDCRKSMWLAPIVNIGLLFRNYFPFGYKKRTVIASIMASNWWL